MNRTTRASVLMAAMLAWTQTGYQYYCTPLVDAITPSTCIPNKQLPLRWYRGEVPVQMDAALCADMTAADATATIRQSFQTWNDVSTCNHPQMIDSGLVSGKKPVVSVKGGSVGNNLVAFQSGDAWRADKAGVDQTGVIALTTLFFDPSTGEIRSYALEANEGSYRFANYPLPAGFPADPNLRSTIDLANTLTHEFGHVMGMDHSLDNQSTMFYRAPAGETSKRTLEADDTNGLCGLYSQMYAEVNPDAETGGGGRNCSAGPTTLPSTRSALLPLLLALATLAAARIRRGRPSGP